MDAHGSDGGGGNAGSVLSVNVGTPRLVRIGRRTVKTAIYKHPVEGPVALRDHGVEGDRQANPSVHGGPEKAAYAYAIEDYRWWESELGRELEPGTFGENLTLAGIDVSGALVGERWRIGDAVVEVSEPRQPCSKLGRRMEDPRFVKRFARALRPGAYLRIVEEGTIAAGEAVEILARPDHSVSMRLMSRIALGERELIPRLREAEALGERWRELAGEAA